MEPRSCSRSGMARTIRTQTDGLEALRLEMSLDEIMRLIERTARWASPETFRRLPVWYPEHHRRGLFYKANWTVPLLNKRTGVDESVHKPEGNTYANNALTIALGLRKKQRPNWSCCHIWGVDDPTFGSANLVVQDRWFYSCIANMVMLPTPLKAFTDVMPEVKAMLRACSFHLYQWRCDHKSLGEVDFGRWTADPAYPKSWPQKEGDPLPPGTIELTPAIAADCDRRLKSIYNDLRHAGRHYPRASVIAALRYWNIPVPADLDDPRGLEKANGRDFT